ncbi:MAG TPA: TMEM43 family protein [Rhodanobacteraceae bacterium]|nr:TMEM43 family protein [Rhodanobacteraceae bacterium]
MTRSPFRIPPGRRVLLVIAAAVLVAVAAAAWFVSQRTSQPAVGTSPTVAVSVAPLPVPSDRVDPANEGRLVSISGPLAARQPARDPELGISADALLLIRHVEMLQWRERCVADACSYTKVWSAQPIDSHAFREANGHVNPGRFPFAQARFQAADLHIGAFDVSESPPAAGARPVAFPVRVAQLPPNLAATFREHNGALYAGNDPDHPAIGDLRVSYRMVPLGAPEVTGIQRGDRLLPSSAVVTQ